MKYKWSDGFSSSIKWPKDALDPFCTVRRYSVDYGGWNGGMCKDFWFFKNALKFAKTRHEIFVDIHDYKTMRSLRIRGEE